MTASDVDATWDIFRRFDDKDWSFTDCSSLVVVRKLDVSTVPPRGSWIARCAPPIK